MFLIFILTLLFSPLPVSADTGHLVISEIQAYGQMATDEFVRLYNPTASAIDISGWKLAKKTSSGSESNLVAKFADGAIIPPNSEFLIAHQTGYLGSESPNARYSGASYSFADNNTIILKDGSGVIVDKVGFGTATDFETAPAANPESGKSIKRLNNQDTDNNKNDFGADASNANISDTKIPLSLPFEKGGVAENPVSFGDIVINEVMPNPAEEKEWVELFNTTAAPINLAGWKISDGSSVIYEPNGTIAARGFFTAEVNNRLNNSGDAVYLSDSGGNSIAQLIYGDWQGAKIIAPEKGQSIARDDGGNYQITSISTKNKDNKITTIVANVLSFQNASSTNENGEFDYSKLSIIEILPNPTDSDTENEYIKIHNGADADIDLGGLYLDDMEGGSPPWKIPAGTIIKAGDDLTFFRTISGLAFNNNADVARILDKNKEDLDAVEYENAASGAIYIFKNGKWGWNSENMKIPPNPPFSKGETSDTLSPSVIPAKAEISSNSITAEVIVPPGVFGSQIMYADGLQLYMYSRDWPELKIGDKIYAFGTPSTYYNEPRLKLKNKSSIKIISHGAPPEPAPADGLSEDDLGHLIIIEGEVVQTASTKIVIDSQAVEIPVYDKTKQKIFSTLKEKDQVQITGIVSQNKDEFRLLPRGADDIKIIQSAVAPLDKKPPVWQYAISTLAVGAFGGAIYFRRRKNDKTNIDSANRTDL